jgi:AsmA-like C-terminal region
LKKIFKIGFKCLIVLLILILILFIGGWIYLKQHKKQVISFIETEAKKGLNGGEIHIGDLRIAGTIDTLVLRDSLWHQHHHDLVSATRAYATLDFFKLILGEISIDRVQLENPQLYLFTDTSGYTNTSIFAKNESPKKGAPKNLNYPVLEIKNGSLTVDKKDKNKFFGYDISRLVCHIHSNEDDPNLKIDVHLDCRVQRMTFNSEKGPFLENKKVAGEFQIQFNKASKVLQFTKIPLLVDDQLFIFTGKFFLAEVPTPFMLSWETSNLPFRKAASFLSKNIRSKLDKYDISESITHLTGSLDNTEPENQTPLIHLRLKVDNKTITTPIVVISNATFTATFNNEEIKGLGHEDENTVMHFSPFRGSWEKLEFHSDSIVIRNLIHPKINLHIISDFSLENINNFFDENAIAFSTGHGKINMSYSGSLETNYDSLRQVTGNFSLDSATINYVPRGLILTKGNGLVRFTGKDVLIDSLNFHSGNTDLVMNGSVKSLFYLISQKNKKLTLDWNIKSNRLNLNDFTSYLKPKQKTAVSKKKKSSLDQTLTEFTDLLANANFTLHLNAKHLIYKKFYADNLVSDLAMNDNAINLKKITLQHGGGSILMEGILSNEPTSNPFTFKAQLINVDVNKIFTAFNSFGLKSPTDKNIKGSLSADITLQGGVTTKAQLIPEALKGFVKFNLQNGQLVDFEPVEKISQTVFKNRNFSDIQFAELHDLLEINGENITVNRMEIHSTVLTMFVEGMYNMKTGPDLSIQVPLSNLKANKDSVMVNKGISSKTGVSARLRAKRGDDGKIKITWDPFNKAGKKIKTKSSKS